MNDEVMALDIDIRPAAESDLECLQQQFSPNSALNYHHTRYVDQQRGDGIYLIAWHLDQPIGHFLLRWRGPIDGLSHRYPAQTPYLEGGATLEAFQRRGVATRIILTAEHLVREKGYRQIGLAVGSSDNPAARRLYERLGYRAWSGGEFTVTWNYESKSGQKGTESEVCIYMFKKL